MVILVELEINGVVYASAKVEQSKLNETICFYRQVGTVRSEGALWEIFIYRKSYKYRKLLSRVTQKLWNDNVLKSGGVSYDEKNSFGEFRKNNKVIRTNMTET